MKVSAKQQIRIDILSKYLCGEIYYLDAIAALEVGERQFRRLVKAFKSDGLISVLHGNCGKSPPNKLLNPTRLKVVQLYRGRFNGLNLVHFREKLIEEQVKPLPSYSTIRNILLKEKLISPQIKRNKKSHPMRKRYQREGLMVQIDGCHHRWLLKKLPCCLTLAMDDATGKILSARFTKTETTFAAMDVVEDIVKRYGAFQMLYSDKAGIYGGGKRDGFSNMNRAMSELGILSIQAHTPQAKGRVERVFRTLQSRLLAELRLNNIDTIEMANKFLESSYIEKFNNQFGVLPEIKTPAYKVVSELINLNEIFCMKQDRVVAGGESVSYQGQKYVLKLKMGKSLIKEMVEVREYRDGTMKIYHQNVEIEFDLLDNYKRAA